jgi:hypothetical protein
VIRSIAWRVISSPGRSYGFVARGDSWMAMAWAFSIVPRFSSYPVSPVSPSHSVLWTR